MPAFLRRILFLLIFAPASLLAQTEVCDNGIDDDGDGLVDLNDTDCICEVIAPISFIPNPSFEDMECCPDNRSQLSCASDWVQASEATTDYINTCGYMGWTEFPPPEPFPDGNGIMGFRDGRIRGNGTIEQNWKEYAGACLLQPLLTDTFYRFQFDVGFVSTRSSPPIDITFFGTTDCNNLPFGLGDDDFGCPTNDPNWIKLGEVNVSGGGRRVWVNTFIDITPAEDIYAIAIGPSCDPAIVNASLYYFFDNLTLAELESFNLQISEVNHPCSDDFSLSIPNRPGFQYQWYLDGVALLGENASDLSQVYGEGSYQVRIVDGGRCRVSAAFEYVVPIVQVIETQSICEGDSFDFGGQSLSVAGSYFDTLKNINSCDSIVLLQLSVIGQQVDTVEVSILEGEVFSIGNINFVQEGIYPVTLTSSVGCDSLVLLDLTTYGLFIPSAFSPNGDAVNDVFRLYVEDDRITSLTVKIFDRWGSLLFVGTEWDGGALDAGVYVYVIDVVFFDGTAKAFSGDVSLIK